MRPILKCASALVMMAAVAGCGDDDGLRVEGRLLKGGEPVIPGEGQSISITFVPVLERGTSSSDNTLFTAALDQENGTFVAYGPHDQGVPPGKYRVALKLKKGRTDLWEGRFDVENSPFVFDVDENTEEIVVDLDKPPLSNFPQEELLVDDGQSG